MRTRTSDLSLRRPVGALLAVTLTVAVPGGAPAAAQQPNATLSISPTSGPLGTVIMATITNCPPPEPIPGGNPSARLDFASAGGTPANTVTFVPGSDGRARVTIEVIDKQGMHGPESRVGHGSLAVSQCGGPGSPGSQTAPTGHKLGDVSAATGVGLGLAVVRASAHASDLARRNGWRAVP